MLILLANVSLSTSVPVLDCKCVFAPKQHRVAKITIPTVIFLNFLYIRVFLFSPEHRFTELVREDSEEDPLPRLILKRQNSLSDESGPTEVYSSFLYHCLLFKTLARFR
jgi:hypothetical protein